MKIAFYNSMYSLNGKSFLDNIIGHWAVHYQSNANQIWKKTDINRTIEILKQANADIVGIGEIIEGQEKEMEEKLRGLGYINIFFGSGHKTKHSGLRVKVAVASKLKSVQKKIDNFPTTNAMGGGGGLVSCYLPKLKIDVLCVHLAASSNKALYAKQILFLQSRIEEFRGKIVLLGDFNKSYTKIKSYFQNLKLASNNIKTCSITPVFNIFHFTADDHIFIKGLEVADSGCASGYSDHKLIYIDIQNFV